MGRNLRRAIGATLLIGASLTFATPDTVAAAPAPFDAWQDQGELGAYSSTNSHNLTADEDDPKSENDYGLVAPGRAYLYVDTPSGDGDVKPGDTVTVYWVVFQEQNGVDLSIANNGVQTTAGSPWRFNTPPAAKGQLIPSSVTASFDVPAVGLPDAQVLVSGHDGDLTSPY
jgi:hypothetical protein